MRSHTVSAEGAAPAVIGSGDSPDEHAYDTITLEIQRCRPEASDEPRGGLLGAPPPRYPVNS
jgi:succinate dehydrogenase/fumarate reductase flavoprotein subunit